MKLFSSQFRFPELGWAASSRVERLARLSAAGFLVALFLTQTLWLSSRLYALSPVSQSLPPISYPLDYGIWVALVLLSAAIVLMPRPRPAIIGATVLYIVYSLWDQQRWIPFFNEIFALFAILSCYSWKTKDEGKAADVLDTCGIVIACIYLWSGIQKLNYNFVADIFPWMMEPFSGLVPGFLAPYLYVLAIAVPFAEIFLGISLLTAKFRNAGIILALAMHAFILASVGPFGLNGNVQVWFWNIVSGAMVIGIFSGNRRTLREMLTVPLWIHKPTLVFFGLMPVLNLVVVEPLGKWDDFQAATLYSGNSVEAEIYLDEKAYSALPPVLQSIVWEGHDGSLFLRIKDWGYKEMNLPDYHALRVHKNVFRGFCELLGSPATGVVMEAGSKSDWRSGERTITRFTCPDVAAG